MGRSCPSRCGSFSMHYSVPVWSSRCSGSSRFVLQPEFHGTQTWTPSSASCELSDHRGAGTGRTVTLPARVPAKRSTRYEAADAALPQPAADQADTDRARSRDCCSTSARTATAGFQCMLGRLFNISNDTARTRPSMTAHAERAETNLSDTAARGEDRSPPQTRRGFAQQALTEYIIARSVARRPSNFLVPRQRLPKGSD